MPKDIRDDSGRTLVNQRDLQVTANSAMSWVVVRDPLPGGAVVTSTGQNRDIRGNEKALRLAFEEKAAGHTLTICLRASGLCNT